MASEALDGRGDTRIPITDIRVASGRDDRVPKGQPGAAIGILERAAHEDGRGAGDPGADAGGLSPSADTVAATGEVDRRSRFGPVNIGRLRDIGQSTGRRGGRQRCSSRRQRGPQHHSMVRSSWDPKRPLGSGNGSPNTVYWISTSEQMDTEPSRQLMVPRIVTYRQRPIWTRLHG